MKKNWDILLINLKRFYLVNKTMFRLLFLFLLISTQNTSNAFKITKLKKLPFNLKENSLWVSNTVNTKSIKTLNEMIPNSHYLYKCKVFDDDLPKYRLFYNIFEVNTPFFRGNRMEIVALIKNKNTYETSFVVLDCFTDALAWDPIDGIKQSNAIFKKDIKNLNFKITVFDKYRNNIFKIDSVKSNKIKTPVRKFSIDSNNLCFFKNHTMGFNLEFNENDVDVPVSILKDYKINTNVYTDFINNVEYAFIYKNSMKFNVIINK